MRNRGMSELKADFAWISQSKSTAKSTPKSTGNPPSKSGLNNPIVESCYEEYSNGLLSCLKLASRPATTVEYRRGLLPWDDVDKLSKRTRTLTGKFSEYRSERLRSWRLLHYLAELLSFRCVSFIYSMPVTTHVEVRLDTDRLDTVSQAPYDGVAP
ncbi:hypothetical protein EV401DRAFT_1404861 [Pisolithus croceorrhizus]|nr:hypothetical protein EV401DRAFT_1404861 [Pisolithus croceorrhizus]